MHAGLEISQTFETASHGGTAAGELIRAAEIRAVNVVDRAAQDHAIGHRLPNIDAGQNQQSERSKDGGRSVAAVADFILKAVQNPLAMDEEKRGRYEDEEAGAQVTHRR